MTSGKYLITCDNWFTAPDGKQYKVVWGEVEVLDDSFLGIKTNRGSSNWYIKVGSEENHIIIAGCQIHYAVKSINRPNTDKVMDWNTSDGNLLEFERPSLIYIAE